MKMIKTWLDYSFRVFDMATMKGLYLLIFLVAITYLMVTNKEKNRKPAYKLIVCCVMALVFLVSPVFGAIASKKSLTQILRLYWTMPFEYLVIYCVIDLLFQFTGKKRAVIVCTIFLGVMALGRQDNLTYPKDEQKWPWNRVENIYKIPQTVYELCVKIENEQNGEPCRAAFPSEWALYVRQYDASILMPYGTYLEEPENQCFAVINADSIDLKLVEEAAINENLDYFIINQSKVVRGKTTDYLKIDTVQDGEVMYGIYKRNSS